MLLVSGRVVYYGEAAVALRYFEALGQSQKKKALSSSFLNSTHTYLVKRFRSLSLPLLYSHFSSGTLALCPRSSPHLTHTLSLSVRACVCPQKTKTKQACTARATPTPPTSSSASATSPMNRCPTAPRVRTDGAKEEKENDRKGTDTIFLPYMQQARAQARSCPPSVRP